MFAPPGRALLVASLLAAAACTRHDSGHSSPAPGAANPSSGSGASSPPAKGADVSDAIPGAPTYAPKGDAPFSASIEGHEVHFVGAVARIVGGVLRVELSSGPLSCDHPFTPGPHYQLIVDAPAGPDRSFLAGKPFVGDVQLARLGPVSLRDSVAVRSGKNRVQYAAFQPIAGEHVRGTLHFDARSSKMQTRRRHDENVYSYLGAGTFDAPLCAVDPATASLEPAPPVPPAPAAPLVATVGGASFTAKSAVAYAFHDDESSDDTISSIELYPDAGVTCANRTAPHEQSVRLAVRGLTSADPATGTPYVVNEATFVSRIPRDTGVPSGNQNLAGKGIVTFDAIGFKPGDHLTGRAEVDGAPGTQPDRAGKISGTFDAVVCAMGAF